MTDWMNLLCWYIFIIMLCDRVTNAQPYTVSSLIYICCILHYFSKWTKYFRSSETRDKKNRQYIYIVENIKFIYTSFVLPVSQRVEMNYIFSTMYVYCIYCVISKVPKKLSNCIKRAETSVVLIVKSALKWCYCFLPSLNMNQGPEKDILVGNQMQMYNKKYPVNAMWLLE